MKNERGMVLAMVWLIAGSGASVIRIYSNQQATEELGLYFLRFIISTVSDVEGGMIVDALFASGAATSIEGKYCFEIPNFIGCQKFSRKATMAKICQFFCAIMHCTCSSWSRNPLRLLLRPNVALVIIFGILQGTHREFHSPYEGCGTRSWLDLSKKFYIIFKGHFSSIGFPFFKHKAKIRQVDFTMHTQLTFI